MRGFLKNARDSSPELGADYGESTCPRSPPDLREAFGLWHWGVLEASEFLDAPVNGDAAVYHQHCEDGESKK